MLIKSVKPKNLVETIANNGKSYQYLLFNETAEISDINQKIIHDKDIVTPSVHRKKVVCPIFYECGGCDFLHIKYDEQLNLKDDYVKRLYQDHQLNTHFLPIIGSDQPFSYRHKIVASATTSKKKLRLGLYREGTKTVIPFTQCKIQDSEANNIIQSLEHLLNQYKLASYDLDTNQGIIKHVLIRKSYARNQYLVAIVTQGVLLPNAKKIVQELIKLHPLVLTVVQNIHQKKTRFVLLDQEKVIYGKGFIEDEIEGIRYRLSAKSFYQVNPVQMMKLYNKALDLAEITKNDTVIDAYSGIGTISLLAAKRAKNVIAIESNQVAHLDALFNKKNNQITNVEFIHDDVAHYLQFIEKQVDVLIMDPARDGAAKDFIESVIQLKPKKIVYISCEPQTQVRDILMFKNHYNLISVQSVDMFSQTVHVETISLLILK